MNIIFQGLTLSTYVLHLRHFRAIQIRTIMLFAALVWHIVFYSLLPTNQLYPSSLMPPLSACSFAHSLL